jgi:hypothetical protein
VFVVLLIALLAPSGAVARDHGHRHYLRGLAAAREVSLGKGRGSGQRAHHDSIVGASRASSASAAPTSCGLDPVLPTAPVAMSMPGCHLLGSDSSANPNPIPFWGSLDCGVSALRSEPGRQQQLVGEGDPHISPTGVAGDPFYRQLTVLDGDDFYGERCELGRNDHNTGPTVFYHEGQHRVTYFSERLPANFPIDADAWQTVMQMKQAQPSHDDGSGVALELQVMNNQWVVANDWNTIQTFPAKANTWTRFAWDVYYSQDPSKGWLQVSADLNGDGDFNDPGERGPVIHTATLQTEISGPFNGEDGIPAGDPIPSHLRMGIYHDPSIPCPAPAGCSIDIDNVQVLAP